MKFLWLVVPCCCLSFSLQACFCCGVDDKILDDACSQERVKISPSSQSKERTSKQVEEGIPLSVILERHLSLEDLNEKNNNKEENEIATVQRVLKSRQNSSDNLLTRRSKLSQSAFSGASEKRRSRNSSVFFSQEIDLDDPLYKEVAREYHEALAKGACDEAEEQGENREFILLIGLLKKHDMPLKGTLGDVKRLVEAFNSSELENEDAVIARKTIALLRQGEIFSKEKAPDYRQFLIDTITYVETAEMSVPQDYRTTLSYLDRMLDKKG